MSTPSIYNAIEYKNPKGDVITTKRDRAVTAWINSQKIEEEHDVVWIQADTTLTPPANYKIKVKGNRRYGIGDVFHIYRSEALNLYATVIDDNHASQGIYWCEIDQAVINHLNSIKSNWADSKGYKMKLRDSITLLDGINETNTGFTVNVYANQYIKITYGSQEHIAIMTERMNDLEWYGIVVNIGNSWGQYNVYVWEQHPTDDVSKIRIKFYETMRFTPQDTDVERYTVDKSPAYITNIRLFKTTIEEEKQPLELLSYFTKDADQALILDNADPRFRAPYISKQR
jgi:hypothetical protein